MGKDQTRLTLFWGRVLSGVLFKAPEDDRSDRQILLEIAKQEFFDPTGKPRRFSLATLKRKLKRYRDQGIDGLGTRPRSDRGAIRGQRARALERAIELKRENPQRSELKINLLLRHEGIPSLPSSTLHRHLLQRGVTCRKLGYESRVIRKRWTRDHTHSLWVGDFSQGPWVIDGEGRSRKTWISAFIDAHSRFVVAGIYAYTSDMDALIRSLLAAFEIHGKPKALYLDNAKVYHSPVLERACLALQIELIHRRVREPEGGGIIERFFQTLQNQLESELRKGRTPLALDRLNEVFEAWVQQVYHKSRHSETNQPPAERYTTGLLCPVSPLMGERIHAIFHHEVTRTVNQDFCDITLDRRLYRVDPSLRGDRVIVRYPLGGLGDTVEILSRRTGGHLGTGTHHDRSQRIVLPAKPLPEETTDFAEIITRIHAREKDAQQLPIAPRHHPWDLGTFVAKVCRQSGTTPESLGEDELELLGRILAAHPEMNANLLRRTWDACSPKSLQTLLVNLAQERTAHDL
jgi:transposase InsO family protein